MRNISGYIFNALLILALAVPVRAQDTLRTYGPRIGFDLAPVVSWFLPSSAVGAELSLDAEIMDNIFPVLELGFSSYSDSIQVSTYDSKGSYGRIGLDYDLYPVPDPSQHHSITIGFRYGISLFTHGAGNITIPSVYWGDLYIPTHENGITAHWISLVAGVKGEVFSNFFLGWSLRYRILLNPGMDQQISPLYIPGFGKPSNGRAFGVTYSLMYKIPLVQK